MIEPPVRLIERHRPRRNSLQNVHAWTPPTLGIRKLLEQTTAKRVQKPLLLPLRISFCVQPYLLAANLPAYLCDLNSTPMRFRGLWARAVQSEQCSAGSSPSRTGISFWPVVLWRQDIPKFLSTKARIVVPAKLSGSNHPCGLLSA